MRSGFRRGMTLAITLVAASLIGPAASVQADWFHRTIPRETLAQDYRTGDVMKAPPIPYGEYVKDHAGSIRNACAKCGSALCGLCGGKGALFGKGCNNCGGSGCSNGNNHGLGLFNGLHREANSVCGDGYGVGPNGDAVGHCGRRHFGKCGSGCLSGLGHHGAGTAWIGNGVAGMPSAQMIGPSAQTTASAQSIACGSCQGKGCGLCGGKGWLKGLYKGCGDLGCGVSGPGCGNACGLGGKGHGGLFHRHGAGCGDGCDGDGDGGSKCGNCGGAGCGLCGGGKSLLGGAHGLVGKILHKGDIKYFVGPGGPVPLTPGYVPYVIPTRSPRDYFAFPPFSDSMP